MLLPEIKKVCVVGGGQMGRQIALNAAIHGFNVSITDNSQDVIKFVEKWTNEYLTGRIKKGKMTNEEVDKAYTCFHVKPQLIDAAEDAEIVIEAIIEDKTIKEEFYKKLDKIVSIDTIIASNSSYIPSSAFKNCIKNPERLANMHYFNPALVMKLVEVVKGEHTADKTVETIMNFAIANGKIPILVKKEIDGFVVNRILRAIRDEAFYLIENDICSPDDLDKGVELGLGHPMGPFKLLDLTGIDLNYLSGLKRWQDTGIKPHGFDIVEAKYKAHEWGKKTGKGFYSYPEL